MTHQHIATRRSSKKSAREEIEQHEYRECIEEVEAEMGEE
jgi:hypothetical protein